MDEMFLGVVIFVDAATVKFVVRSRWMIACLCSLALYVRHQRNVHRSSYCAPLNANFLHTPENMLRLRMTIARDIQPKPPFAEAIAPCSLRRGVGLTGHLAAVGLLIRVAIWEFGKVLGNIAGRSSP